MSGPSKHDNPMRVDLLGVFPPPLGGISVHLSRVSARLEAAGVRVERHPAQQSGPYFAYWADVLRKTRGADLIHAHLHGVLDLTMLGLLARTCRRVVLTIHGDNVVGPVLQGQKWRAALVRELLRSFAMVVCVNDRLSREVVALGVPPDRVVSMPAFVPPDRDELLAFEPPPEVRALLARSSPLLAANAFTFDLYGGRLLYGQDQLVELVARLAPHHPRVGLAVHLSRTDGEGRTRLAAVEQRARELGVKDRIAWVEGSQPFGPTLVRAQAMVRPTATDGDAVSVREALHLGVPVVASDVVSRPGGCFVSPLGDLDALTRCTEEALALPERDRVWPQPDVFPELLTLYRRTARSQQS